MAKKLFVLFIAHAGIDQYQSVAILNQKQRMAQVHRLFSSAGLILFHIDFWDNTEHSAAV